MQQATYNKGNGHRQQTFWTVLNPISNPRSVIEEIVIFIYSTGMCVRTIYYSFAKCFVPYDKSRSIISHCLQKLSSVEKKFKFLKIFI